MDYVSEYKYTPSSSTSSFSNISARTSFSFADFIIPFYHHPPSTLLLPLSLLSLLLKLFPTFLNSSLLHITLSGSFSYPIPSSFLSASSYKLPSLPIYYLPLPQPLLCPIPLLPLPSCRTIRKSTWSTYTAGLTACAPRMRAPTSSSPPLPSI